MSLVERIKEERQRKQIKSQAEMANLVGTTRETWGRYERGEALPSGDVLLKMSEQGFDIGYIFTGNRIINQLQPEEITLLEAWRSADFNAKFDALQRLLKK
jgi:transcriptional regulator with XRE-family HTH domain